MRKGKSGRLFLIMTSFTFFFGMNCFGKGKYELKEGELWSGKQITHTKGTLLNFDVHRPEDFRKLESVGSLISPNGKYAACSKFLEEVPHLDDFGEAHGTEILTTILIVDLATGKSIRELSAKDVNEEQVSIRNWTTDNGLEFFGSGAGAAWEFVYDVSSNKIYERGNFSNGAHLREIINGQR